MTSGSLGQWCTRSSNARRDWFRDGKRPLIKPSGERHAGSGSDCGAGAPDCETLGPGGGRSRLGPQLGSTRIERTRFGKTRADKAEPPYSPLRRFRMDTGGAKSGGSQPPIKTNVSTMSSAPFIAVMIHMRTPECPQGPIRTRGTVLDPPGNLRAVPGMVRLPHG